MSRLMKFGLLVCFAMTVTGCRKAEDAKTGDSNSDNTGAKKSIKVVAFDEHDDTLQAITNGECYGTVVQNPYMYGHESVRILAALAKGEAALPENNELLIPARTITKENVAEFWTDLKEKQKAGSGTVETVEGRDTVAYVTNGVASFWDVAAAGAKVAAREAGVNLDIKMPTGDTLADQKRILEDLSSRSDISGIAVSPINPVDQGDLLNGIGDKKNYITHDSDAPKTNRKAYIGMSNYDAGRECGKLVKAALPDGGNIVIFVGRLDQDNAKLRRQGVIDELLDRNHDDTRYDKNEEIKGDKYTIYETMTDQFDFAKSKQNAEDAISKYPDMDCMVGLFAYNPPHCLDALRAAGRLAKGSSDVSAKTDSKPAEKTGAKTE